MLNKLWTNLSTLDVAVHISQYLYSSQQNGLAYSCKLGSIHFFTLNKVQLSDLRYQSICLEKANMHSQGIACTRSLDMGLTSAEGQKL